MNVNRGSSDPQRPNLSFDRTEEDHVHPGEPPIDRTSQAIRPQGKNAGLQSWRNLLFLHWPIDVDMMRPLVPEELELDLFEGKAWVGLVPFRMQGIRPPWLPEAFAFNFLECNVRTYVLHKGEPGVYFFSLDASSFLAVRAARLGWSLPYHYARMSETMPDGHIRYEVHRTPDATLDVRYRVGESLGASAPGTREHFFLERYLLFTRRRRRLLRGQVHHSPYPAYTAELLDLSESLLGAVGLDTSDEPPALVHWSPGVDVEVFSLR